MRRGADQSAKCANIWATYIFGFDTSAQLLALASPSRVIQYRNSRDWEVVVLLLKWSYYWGCLITEVVPLLRWFYYWGGPITDTLYQYITRIYIRTYILTLQAFLQALWSDTYIVQLQHHTHAWHYWYAMSGCDTAWQGMYAADT